MTITINFRIIGGKKYEKNTINIFGNNSHIRVRFCGYRKHSSIWSCPKSNNQVAVHSTGGLGDNPFNDAAKAGITAALATHGDSLKLTKHVHPL